MGSFSLQILLSGSIDIEGSSASLLPAWPGQWCLLPGGLLWEGYLSQHGSTSWISYWLGLLIDFPLKQGWKVSWQASQGAAACFAPLKHRWVHSITVKWDCKHSCINISTFTCTVLWRLQGAIYRLALLSLCACVSVRVSVCVCVLLCNNGPSTSTCQAFVPKLLSRCPGSL